MPKSGPENNLYFYYGNHLGSPAYITTEMPSIREDHRKMSTTEQNGYATQFLAYPPFGETLAEQWSLSGAEGQNSTSYYSSFKFSAKEKDIEMRSIREDYKKISTPEQTGYSYFGARYYSPELSIWLSVDPLADLRSWVSPYGYCQNNPIGRVDPTGALDSDHIDVFGNIIAHYDDGDKSVYVHKYGTTEAQVDAQRTASNNTGGSGTKIGEIGGNIDASGIMFNKLKASGEEAKGMGVADYFFAVKPKGVWDLKANTNTIFGLAWKSDQSSGTKTTFSFSKYSGMNAADV